MRVFLSVVLLLFCCVRDSRENIVSETERGVKSKHEVSETDRNCHPDMCELLMKIGAMEARLEATEMQNEAMEAMLKATQLQVATLQTEKEAINVRLAATETKNEAMEAWLMATEKQVAILQTENEAMEARLMATEKQAVILQTENGAMDARLKATEQQVAILQTENEELTVAVDSSVSQLRDVHTRLTSSEIHLQQLLETSVKSKVAFSAGLGGGDASIGPFNTDTTLKYSVMHSNIGNAYSPNTGIFTAPVKAVYHFSYYHHHSVGHGGFAYLCKNKQWLAVTYGYNSDGQYNTAAGVTVPLEKGDEVYVILRSGSWVYTGNIYSHFNGILLFTL